MHPKDWTFFRKYGELTMSNRSSNYFEQFWNKQTSGLSSSGVTYEESFRELSFFLPPHQLFKALELGCGNGDMFEHAQAIYSDYTGIDFSSSNLDTFKARFPQAKLQLNDAINPQLDERFDLIHSLGFVQYLNYEQLKTLLKNNMAMLKTGGFIVHQGFMDIKLQGKYFSGYLKPGVNKSSLQKCLRPALFKAYDLASRIFRGGTPLGIWHSTNRINDICEELGLSYKIYGSMTYRYRFNLVITNHR